jgi:predicted PurR-regulated permease PerM
MSGDDERATARRVGIAIGLVLATALGLLFVYATRRVLIWIVIAVFFAVALYPVVNWTERRVTRIRWLATLLVFLTALGILGVLTALIIVPLVGEVARLVDRLPQLLQEARDGRGPIGGPLERFHLRQYAEEHHEQLQQLGSRLREPTVGVVRGAATTVVGVLTVTVLAYLMVLQAPKIVETTLDFVPARHTERVRRIGTECARTITGYLSGNLLISAICGGLTFATMAIMGVPYAGVLALLVAIADLVPLVGATTGAVIATGASFFHSNQAGIVVLVFFVVYQQVENHVLQPLILSRIVRLNPLTVLVSLLVAADLAGILGALLAIPAAGITQIVLRDLRDGRRRPPEDRRASDRTPPDGRQPPPRDGGQR